MAEAKFYFHNDGWLTKGQMDARGLKLSDAAACGRDESPMASTTIGAPVDLGLRWRLRSPSWSERGTFLIGDGPVLEQEGTIPACPKSFTREHLANRLTECYNRLEEVTKERDAMAKKLNDIQAREAPDAKKVKEDARYGKVAHQMLWDEQPGGSVLERISNLEDTCASLRRGLTEHVHPFDDFGGQMRTAMPIVPR